MRSHSLVLSLVILAQGLSNIAWAETMSGAHTKVAMCDPYMDFTKIGQDQGDQEDDQQSKKVRYDLETSEILTSDEAIMEAIYEEKWDVASGEPIARQALCQDVGTYVVNWATLTGAGDDGETTALAQGLFSLRKDGTFQFDYNKRPYVGTWTTADHMITLSAPWLNDGAALVTPVERVKTPVEVTGADGVTDSYTEEVYRIGPFRLLPIDTTVKGSVMNCACPTK